ncbi:MAG: AMP-binding protein [Cytophagaceae bacterium]
MFFVHYNGRKFSAEDIITNKFSPVDEYESGIFQFCREWLIGKSDFIITTSGSTSVPKPVHLSRKQMEASAAMTGKALSLSPGDKALVCLNTDYIAGKMMLVRGMYLNLELYITKPTSFPFEDFDSGIKFHFTALVPLQLEKLLEYSGFNEFCKEMKAIIVGGAPVSENTEAKTAMIDVPVYATYGMTETVSHVALRRMNGMTKSSVYTLLEGITAGADERGCLWVKGEVSNNETVQTNDIVEFVGNNQFIWKGRYDNVINSGGIKIFPEELEKEIAAVFQSLKISSRFFISSIPDQKLNEKVILIIETIEKYDEAELMRSLKKSIDSYKTPKKIYYLSRFIETESGKIDRKKNRDTVIQHLC